MTGPEPAGLIIPQALLDGLSREEIARTVNTLMTAEMARGLGLADMEHLRDAYLDDEAQPMIVVHRRCRVCGYDSVRDDDPTRPVRYWRADGVCASCPR